MSKSPKSRIDWIWFATVAVVFGFAWLSDHVHSARFSALVALGLVAGMSILFLFRWARDRNDEGTAPKVRMYCIVAKESLDLMKGVRGKLVAQGGHAWLHSYWDAEERFPHHVELYRRTRRAYKITLVTPQDADLHKLLTAYSDVCGVSLVEALLVPTVGDLERLKDAYSGVCGVSLVTDAGFTVFEGPTTTCLGIGPIPEDLIGEDLKSLKTLT